MSESSQHKQAVLTVSQLNRRTRQLLETHFPLLWIEGEISNLARPSSGHMYFTLKDDQAQVRAAMFRNRNQSLNFKPGNGTQVLARCRVGLYEGRGEFQLIVEHLEEAGFGALQRQYDALKSKLTDEGLFQDAHKQSIPDYPRHLGVITSATGAAIHDVLSVLARRFPALPVSVYPVAVQGEAAPAEICAALQRANQDMVGSAGQQQNRCDLLLLTRGGGSIEDLWAFNDERVARTIFNSNLPIVSAVGHEVDFTIADFVADVRAPTPSAAAELISGQQEALADQLAGYEYFMAKHINHQLERYQQQLNSHSKRLRHPRERLADLSQKLDHLELRLQRHTSRELTADKLALSTLNTRLTNLHPKKRLDSEKNRQQQLQQRLNTAIKQLFDRKRAASTQAASLLHAVSPLATLDRGYTIISNAENTPITQPSQVSIGEQLSARIAGGTLTCSVIDKSLVHKPVAQKEANIQGMANG